MNSIGIKYFFGVEAALYLSYLSLDISGFFWLSSLLKYGAILLLFGAVTLMWRQGKMKISLWLILLFSVFADYWLLFTNQYEIGIAAFFVVQLLLFTQIHVEFRHSMRFTSLLLVVIALFSVFTLQGILQLDGMVTMALLYFLLFSINVILSWSFYFRTNHQLGLFLCVGLTLFYCCDIQVGIHNSFGYLITNPSLFDKLDAWASVAMWLFYLPGQILIAFHEQLLLLLKKDEKKLAQHLSK